MVTDERVENLKDDDNMVLQGTTEDLVEGTLMSTNGTLCVLDLHLEMNQLNNYVNQNRVIPLNSDANGNLLAYEDQANQDMDKDKPMAN